MFSSTAPVKINFRLAKDRVDTTLVTDDEGPRIYTPGEVITPLEDFMRGHGTYVENESIKASVAGALQRITKLITILPLKQRYFGEVGDVVIGRIKETQQKRWKVDVNARQDAVLLISSVNLPGGELRRRCAEDEYKMRSYLQEGDLLSAEIKNVHSDGTLYLHTRSLKYGKLGQGMLVRVPPLMIRRRKSHFYNLSCGASIIIGNNGCIWISPIQKNEDGGFTQNLEEHISKREREIMVRLRNCIMILAKCRIMLYETSIMCAYEESLRYPLSELLTQEAGYDVALRTHASLRDVKGQKW